MNQSMNMLRGSPNTIQQSRSTSKLTSAVQTVKKVNKLLLSEKKYTNSSNPTDVSSPYKVGGGNSQSDSRYMV